MKLVGAIVIVFALGFIGFVATVMASLSMDAGFYAPFIPTVTVGLMVMVILGIYGKWKHKGTKISGIVFLCLCMVSVVIYEGYQAYLGSLEVVSTQDVDLSEYQPFVEGTKAVSLEEHSSFKIENNLPLLDGATALYPIYSAFAQAVYPDKEYPLYEGEVVSSQTSYAFERLLSGEVDMVFMAHPSQQQMSMAEQQGVSLKLTPIGREAFVFFVHQKNPVEALTMEQLQGIYSGEITNWNEVGGNNEEIRAFQRPEGSGSQTALINVMKGIPIMEPPSKDIVSAMGGIIKETTNYRNRTNAIGFSFRHFSQEMVNDGEIKNIAVEGVLPSKENIQNESYPIVDQFYCLTAGSDNPYIDPFIDWMLSEQGQWIVEQTGYVPLH